jgi:hypothetical protein
MKNKIVIAVLTAVVVFLAVPAARAEFAMGVSGDSEGLNNFYIAVGDYNRIPEREVVVVRQQGIPDEELPVVFFLAAHARVPYTEIVRLRLNRWTWMKIALKYRLDPGIFYMPVNETVSRPPYGRAYGYYMKWPKHKWKNIRLDDKDIINCVNLRFMSEHYGHDPVQVIRMREQGRNFVVINREVRDVHVKNVKVIKVKGGKGKHGR